MPSCFSHVQLFVTLWTIALQAPLSMGFCRQEYQSGLPFRPPGALPDPGIEPKSLMPPALAGGFFTTSATWEACYRAMKSWSGDSSQIRVTIEGEDSAIHRIIQFRTRAYLLNGGLGSARGIRL